MARLTEQREWSYTIQVHDHTNKCINRILRIEDYQKYQRKTMTLTWEVWNSLYLNKIDQISKLTFTMFHQYEQPQILHPSNDLATAKFQQRHSESIKQHVEGWKVPHFILPCNANDHRHFSIVN